jgi:regulator of replication initiation timing
VSDNESIDKLADEYSNTDVDQKAYIKAQSSTIISQTKEINSLKRELEKLAKENERLLFENTRLVAVNPEESSKFQSSDEETICVVQLAILKNYAMSRELTMEECKKTEIYVKTLKEIRGKKIMADDGEKVEALSNEELLKLMESVGKEAS